MEIQDKTLTCSECGLEFVFTEGEQKFYQEKGFTHEPKRCKECRARKKDDGRSGRPRTRDSASGSPVSREAAAPGAGDVRPQSPSRRSVPPVEGRRGSASGPRPINRSIAGLATRPARERAGRASVRPPDQAVEENDELVRLVRELNASVGRPAQPAASEPATTPAPIPDAGETAPSTPPAGGAPASDPVSEMPPSPPVPAPSEADEASQGAVESLRPTAEKLDVILARAVRERASDVLLVAGFPPTVRVHGYLQAAGEDPLTPADTRLLPCCCSTRPATRIFSGEGHRFLFREGGRAVPVRRAPQRGSVALALRAFPKRIPSLEELNLPPTLRRFTQLQRGLVLFVGPTAAASPLPSRP